MTGGGVLGVVAAAGTTLVGVAADESVGGRFDEEHAVATVIAANISAARVGKRIVIDAMYGRRGAVPPDRADPP